MKLTLKALGALVIGVLCVTGCPAKTKTASSAPASSAAKSEEAKSKS